MDRNTHERADLNARTTKSDDMKRQQQETYNHNRTQLEMGGQKSDAGKKRLLKGHLRRHGRQLGTEIVKPVS